MRDKKRFNIMLVTFLLIAAVLFRMNDWPGAGFMIVLALFGYTIKYGKVLWLKA